LFRKTFRREEVEQAYRQHAAALIVFACSILGERARAQDVVQQVFLRLVERPVESPDDARAYLFTAVRNASMNDLRSSRRFVELNEEESWFDGPEQQDVLSERNLRRALWNLPDEQRQIVVMHVWGELTFAAIAEVLDISPNTAASRYRYGLERLREQMTGNTGNKENHESKEIKR
jgi:RNA polymerase sigma-70 factor (ECF subfamily)